MKNYFNLRKKSKLLLLMLLAVFVGGVSPAWAQMTIFSEGFESNSLSTNGWTTSNPGSSAINSNAARTGSYGYRFNYYSSGGPRYLISPEISIPATASDISLTFYYKKYSGSYTEKFKVGYSTTTNDLSNFTWSDEVTDATTTEFKEYTNTTLPSGTKYFAIQYCSGDAYYLYIDDISLTCALSGPAMTVTDGTTPITSGYNYSFGLTTSGTTKEFTLSNPGTEAAPISVSHTGNFGAVLSATSIPAGESVMLTVTMPETSGDDVITISSTSDAIDDFVINVSGTVKDASKMWCNFSGGLPDGWNNKDSWTIVSSGADGITSGGGFARNTSYNSNKLIYSPLVTFAEGEKLYFMAKGNSSTASWNVLKVQYSSDGNTWTTAKDLTGITNTWQSIEVSEIPAGNWYIGFYGSYAFFTDVYGGTESTAPVLALSQSSYDFGLISMSTTTPDAITITNTGKSALTGMSITSDNPNFTVSVTDNATTIAANGGTATFNVTMAPNATGAQSATITVKSDNADDLTFTVTGAVAKVGTTTIDFNDNTLPTGWNNSSNPTWSFSDGTAYAGSSYWGDYAELTTSKMRLASDDFLAFKVKAASSSYGTFKVYSSTDGTTFNSTPVVSKSYTDLSTSDYTTVILSGLAAGDYFFKIEGYYMYLDEVAGVVYAPTLAVTQGGNAVTTPTDYAFGELGADATVTYNFNNTGAGTINITNIESSNEVFTTNWTETVAAFNYDLVITANYDADKAGEQNGAITVTTTEGEFVIYLTSTFLPADAPSPGLYIGDATDVSASGAAFDYGIITANSAKSFKIKNDGTGTLQVTGINLPEGYSIDITAPTTETPLSLTAGQSQTINVTLAATAKAVRNDNIVVSFAGGLENFTFAATATILVGTEIVDFATAIPSTWDNESNGWSIQDGAAKCTGKKNLTTSKLTFGENDFFVFKVKASDSGAGDYVTVEGSADNGTTWTAFDKKTYSYSGDFGANTGDYSTIVVEVPSTVNKLRFNGYYVLIDEIAGLVYDENDPKMGIYSDEECTAAVATSVTKDFGFATETQTATYYIKNDGTGTMTLSLGDAPEGITQALDKTSVAAGEHATLTITMPVENKGYNGGNVVVTATDLGTFTVAASGVIVDENKLYLDFATANIPSTWTTGNWTKSDYGYIENSNYSSSSIETSDLIATAGEDIIIEADMYTTSSYYTLGVNYRKAGDEEWSTLIAASNVGTSWTKLRATIEEAGTYQLQFVGTRAQIRRIYGLSMPMEPVMAVYDGENLAGASYNFGSVTNDADAVKVFTVKNEGLAELTGLAAALSGDNAAHYTVEVSATTVAAGSSATVTVTQLKDNLGAHSATLTISATDLDNKVIALSGMTRDASKLFEDFEDGVPANWTASGWSRSSANGNYFMQAAYSGTNTLTLPIINVAANEQLSVDLSKQYSSTTSLTMRYTTNGGVTWTETNLSNDLTYGNFTTKTLSLGNTEAATAQIQFVGSYYARIDNFYGGSVTTAPMISLTEGGNAVESGSTKNFGTLTSEAGTATYVLSNAGTADMVSTIATTGDVTFEVTAIGEGVTKSENTLTIPAGKTATIVVTMAYAAPFTAKSGAMTISTEGWVGDFTVNYTGATLDPTAFYEDFAGNAKPEGWYNSSWSFSSGYASCLSSGSLITQKLTVEGAEDVLSYDAAKSSSWASSSKITISYSTDRKNWIEASSNALSSTDYTTFNISGLEAGEYYLKFDGVYAKIDNIMGWHKVTGIDHDLYVSASNIPTATKLPEAEITATATVYSLRAAEEGVYAKLFFNETEVATAEAQDISKDGSKTFTLTGNVPAEEKTYAAKIVVYYGDATVAWETATTDVEVAHTRTLAITAFERVGEGTMEANSNNQISPVFTVTVKNNGSTNYTSPTVKVFNDEVEVGTATSDATVAPGESTELTVTATNMSAGEGGELSFTAKACWDAAEFSYATPVVIEVTAAAPKFELAEKGGEAVENGAAVSFGLVREATTKSYTITNTGTKALELVSIVAPEGYEATAVTDENKTIAIDGTLDIDITLKALQGKKTGNLVFTYKVDDLTNKTFTLNLDGQSIAEDTWVETFDTAISADWTGDISSSDWQWNSTYKAAYSSGYNYSHVLISPRLAATAGDELTFDVNFTYDGYNLKAEYSTDKSTWTEIGTYEYADRGTKIFTAPADGNYYLRFTAYRYALLDNLIGFRLNQPEHEIEIASSTVPTTGTQYAQYTATVRLKEILNKAEEVTAKLYVDGEAVAETTETIAAKATTTVSINWIPQETIATEVDAYIEVTYAGGTLATTPVSLTIDAPYELDEEEGTVVAGTYPALLLNRTFAAGWNTVCLPFSVATADVETLFGEGTLIYDFTGYADGNLNFTKTTSLIGGYPYIIYVKEAISEPIVVRNVTISNLNTTASYDQFNGAYFRGTYAPIAAPGMQGKYGVTKDAKIAKGTDKASMKGFRAYFELPDGANARLAFINEDGTVTVINAVELDNMQDGNVYNLQGQRVEGMKKGLYIINGKKVVRK